MSAKLCSNCAHCRYDKESNIWDWCDRPNYPEGKNWNKLVSVQRYSEELCNGKYWELKFVVPSPRLDAIISGAQRFIEIEIDDDEMDIYENGKDVRINISSYSLRGPEPNSSINLDRETTEIVYQFLGEILAGEKP